MSPRELRLRQRIDALLDERDHLRRRNKAPKLPSPRRGFTDRRCIYCGARTRTSRVIAACPSHRDLLAVDPHYMAA